MIVSASRRTDIPAFYVEWLLGRLREGYALAVNPMNPRQARRVSLLPEDVDALVFWSKNPRPLLAERGALSGYAYYLQFTLNAYGPEVEPGLPGLEERIGTLLRWAEAVGPDRVIWRYDPILLSEAYPAAFHLERFENLAGILRGAVRQVTVSFMDDYAKIRRRVAALGARCPSAGEIPALAAPLAQIARAHGLRIAACAEPFDLSGCGIGRARCVDGELIAAIGGKEPKAGPDPNQRPGCGCLASVDIGAYNCCVHGCAYCYANAGEAAAERNRRRHDPRAASLLGTAVTHSR